MKKNQIAYSLPLIITRNQVYFPNNTSDDLDAGRPFTVKAIETANETSDKLVIVATQKIFTENSPLIADIHEYGVLARLTKVRPRPHHITVRLEPLLRVKITDIKDSGDFLLATAVSVESSVLPANFDEQAAILKLFAFIQDNLELSRRLNMNLQDQELTTLSLEEAIYLIANKTINNTEQRMFILSELNINARLEKLIKYLDEDLKSDSINAINQLIRNQGNVETPPREDDKEAKPDEDEELDTNEEILQKLESRFFPDFIKRRVKKEVRRMSRNENERARTLEYIDWLLKLPYDQETIDNLDLDNVQKVLDHDHYGLEEPKKRIVEYIAVKRMAKGLRAPIICFYGPPGTGKTSLAMSIANAMGRKLVKSSLGGVDDEAKLRGFLRTYIGSQPGIIISNMRRAGTINPIFVLDEVDKLGVSRQGDPSAALLEILDPQQNKSFIDHYIEEQYDLSKVIFIATANDLYSIPRALRDRMELIQLKPYTEDEKIQIAKRHLIPNQIEEHGLSGYEIKFEDTAIREIIDSYTFEAGVRALDKQIASILRKLSVEILTDKNPSFTVTVEEVKRHLGQELLRLNEKEKESVVGIVTGLSVIGDIGGDILPIEVTTFKGKGGIKVTGNLERMMEESGQIAATHVRSYAKRYGIDPDIFEKIYINVHFPDAATKDGNSAGVAMTVGIISALTNRKVNCDIAMTGEVTIMGKVLAIGGVQEKIIGAIRAGIKTVIIPAANKSHYDKMPQEIKDKIEVVMIKSVQEAVDLALLPLEAGEEVEIAVKPAPIKKAPKKKVVKDTVNA